MGRCPIWWQKPAQHARRGCRCCLLRLVIHDHPNPGVVITALLHLSSLISLVCLLARSPLTLVCSLPHSAKP